MCFVVPESVGRHPDARFFKSLCMSMAPYGLLSTVPPGQQRVIARCDLATKIPEEPRKPRKSESRSPENHVCYNSPRYHQHEDRKDDPSGG